MKKNSVWIILTLIILCFAVGCADSKANSNSNDEWKEYESGCDENNENSKPEDECIEYKSLIWEGRNDGLSVPSEIDFWTGEYCNKSDMPNRSYEVLGKEYELKYANSIIDTLNSYETDFYNDENGATFGFRSDTGAMVLANFMDNEFFDTAWYLPDVTDPEKSAISLATEVAGNYINIDEYDQIIDDPQVREKKIDGKTYSLTYYFITFARKIDGYWTSDFITVKVTSKGNVATIFMGDLDAFKNVIFKEIDADLLFDSVSKKLHSKYQERNLSVESLEITDQKIAKMPNGNFCMYSDVSIEVVESDDVKYRTGVSVLTALDFE